jgi:hypothetical integral membrane protein (TIGR02206 family)
MEKFELFSLAHALALAGIAALAWLFTAVGRRAAAPTALERTLAWTNLAMWVAAHGWWLMPPQLDPATTLPLQLCHITAVIASLVLLTRHHALRVLLYFWSFALSTQALLTPALADPPASIWFWAFWAQHGFVIAVAVHDVAVYKFRPSWRDYGLACRVNILYGLAMLPVNLALGANYGFVGNSRPETQSVIDLIGPWPERLVVIVLLVAAVMALLMLPWEIARRRR